MQQFRLLSIAAALAALSACHTGGGGAPSTLFGPPAVSQTITSGITVNAGLYQAVDAPDGRIWFSEFSGNNLAAVTTAGAVKEYPMFANAQPSAITVGTDGNIWTGGYGGEILSVTILGKFTAYPIAGAHIGGLAVGPDNNIWYTDYGNDKVGYITTSGLVNAYKAPIGTSPTQIAKGNDGNLWVTDSNGSILRVTTAGFFTQFKTGITSGGSPQAIVLASDGDLYFTEPFFSSTMKDRIGKVTVGGTISEVGSLAPNAYPNQIAVGKDGSLYFTEYGAGNLGKVTVPNGTVSEIALGIVNGSGIVNGPDNNLWVGGRQTIYKITY